MGHQTVEEFYFKKEQAERQRSGGPAANKTRRDELALAAMSGMMDGYLRHEVDDFGHPELADESYKIADAMIKRGEE